MTHVFGHASCRIAWNRTLNSSSFNHRDRVGNGLHFCNTLSLRSVNHVGERFVTKSWYVDVVGFLNVADDRYFNRVVLGNFIPNRNCNGNISGLGRLFCNQNAILNGPCLSGWDHDCSSAIVFEGHGNALGDSPDSSSSLLFCFRRVDVLRFRNKRGFHDCAVASDWLANHLGCWRGTCTTARRRTT